MTRILAVLATFYMALSFPACKILGQIPAYRETNNSLQANAQPYEVRREQPYPKTLIDTATRERSRVNRSLDSVFGLATAWRPEDVANRNRSKLERALGRPIKRPDDKTHPIHADPFPDIDVILALSGGGHRAANLSSSVMFELSRLEVTARNGRQVTLLDTVDTISSVSGGGFAAAFYIYHRSTMEGNTDPRKAEYHRDLIEVGMRENISRRLLKALIIPTKISFWIRGFTRANRTNLYSNLLEYRIIRPNRIESLEATIYPAWWRERPVIYHSTTALLDLFWLFSPATPDDQYLFGVPARTFDDLFLRDPDNPNQLYPLRPEWLINATSYNEPVERNQLLFDADTFNRLGSDWMAYRVSDAVASSAAFPVMFAPMALRNYRSDPNTWEFAFDGGVSDNQGMNGVRAALDRKPASHRAVVIMVDASPRSEAGPGENSDRPGGMAIANRALERYMGSVRDQSIEELRSREASGELRFFHLSIQPEEFGAPLTEEQKAAFEKANHVPTALNISRGNQDTLFEVGRILVERDREAIVSALTAVTSPARVHPQEKSSDDPEP